MSALKIIFFCSVVFYSCNQSDKFEKCVNFIGLNDSLYEIILNYQKLNPLPELNKSDTIIPALPETAFRYVYEVEFFPEKENIVVITLNADGIKQPRANSRKNLYGIYEDSCLKPTYFICDTASAKKFLGLGIKKDLEKFIYNNSSIIDIIYSSYVFKIQNDKFYFLKKIPGNQSQ